MSTELSHDLLAYISDQFKFARAILMTGAGFSVGAKDINGTHLPLGDSLAKEIWNLCYPGVEYDNLSTLQDLFDYAQTAHRKELSSLLQSRLTVDSRSLPGYFSLWLNAPWRRIYTLNIDDLPFAASRSFEIPRKLIGISGTQGRTTDRALKADELEVIYLNGMLDDLPDNVTFSTSQYSRRLANREATYHKFVSDLLSHPFIFVGTVLDESPLWQHIEMRGERGARQLRELRPRSILISPKLSIARQELLKKYNVDWIQGTAETFSSHLTKLRPALEAGLKSLQRETVRSAQVALVPELLEKTSKASVSFFLLGAEPEWYDIVSGRAIKRSHDDDLLYRANTIIGHHSNRENDKEKQEPKVLAILGTAASGKSTTIMRLSATLSAAGRKVAWIDRTIDISPKEIKKFMRENEAASVVVIDDADRYGIGLCGILNDLQSDSAIDLVVIGLRSSKVERCLAGPRLMIPVIEYAVPGLSDGDVDKLIAVLEEENKLGILTGKSQDERIAAFRDVASRQLLVAMMEATSGVRFEQKVVEEWEQLQDLERSVYSIVALSTSFRFSLDRNDIMLALGDLASGGTGNETLNAIINLTRRHILLANDDGTMCRARHRHIADVLLNELQRSNRLGSVHIRLAFVAASKVSDTMPRTAKPWRLLKSILNHDYLFKMIGLDGSRKVYDQVDEMLRWDYHYLLQRGSLEVEEGDIRVAQNYLSAAYSIAPDDPLVATEYAYMLVKRAIYNPGAQDATKLFNDGIGMLDEQIQQRGKTDSYPVHVYGSQMLAWVRRATIPRDEKQQLLRSALRHLDSAIRDHQSKKELFTLRDDLNRDIIELKISDK